MSQESGSQGLFPEITLPRPSLGTLRASVSLRPTQRPILPSMVIPTVILRFILCHLSSRAFLSYNQPCSTQTDFSLIQDLTKYHSPAKKKRNSLYFSFLSKARTEAPGMPDISQRALGYNLADSASGLRAAQMKGFISTRQQRNPKCSCKNFNPSWRMSITAICYSLHFPFLHHFLSSEGERGNVPIRSLNYFQKHSYGLTETIRQ